MADLYAAAPVLRELGTPDPELVYSWAADAGHAIGRLPLDARAVALRVVETHLAGGSQSLRNLLATGLLEALASDVSGGRLDGPALGLQLGPESRVYLDAWDLFTMGRSTLE